MVVASSFSEISIYISEIVDEYKKNNYTNKSSANIKNVGSRFPWWHKLSDTVKKTIIESAQKKL